MLRFFAALICICLIAAPLFSSAFILTHSRHAHDHLGPSGGCATCVSVKIAENLLKALGSMLIICALFLGGRNSFLGILNFDSSNLSLLSPVALKVRLNN
jgi:hypothetical protein